MPNIDPDKLRRFHAEAKAAHAALMRASEAYRFAREDLSSATGRLEEAREPVPGVKRVGAEAEKPLVAAVKSAEATFARAEEERERLHDAWTHANRIWTKCRDFAAEHGALPNDLKD